MKICEPGGGGIILPLFGDAEQEWRRGIRAFLYLLGLLWLFLAVAAVSDIFMNAIEEITSKKKRILTKSGKHFTIKARREGESGCQDILRINYILLYITFHYSILSYYITLYYMKEKQEHFEDTIHSDRYG